MKRNGEIEKRSITLIKSKGRMDAREPRIRSIIFIYIFHI